MKKRIEQIPLVGKAVRWVWAIMTISRSAEWNKAAIMDLQRRTDALELSLAPLQRRTDGLEFGIASLQHRTDALEHRISSLAEEIVPLLRSELYRIGRSQQYRIDQFLFDVGHRLADSSVAQRDAIADASETLDPFYLAFEDRFRGSREVILERCREYLPLLSPLQGRIAPTALDLGCGRGEWLQTLLSAGFQARGIDLGGAMVASCTEAGLEVEQLSALEALRTSADESLDLISAFHLIEHLPWNELYTLAAEILRVLKPGGLVLLETPNTQNLLVASQTFYKDPTHRNPVHPDTLQFLLEYHGAREVSIHPLHPFPHSMHLEGDGALQERLNSWIYGPQDYLAVGVK